LASVFILGLAGFAAGVIPQACRSGVVICKASAPEPIPADIVLPAETAAPSAAPSLELVADVAPAPDATAIDTMIKQQPAALTRNDLIAQTFAALDPEFTAPSGELTARKVRTVSIGPDGMPVIEGAQPAATEAAELVAEEEPAAEETSTPVQVAEAEEPEPEPVVADEPPAEEDATAAAYAPVRGGDAVIGRQGANVRSAPKTRGSSVLFALAPGEDVTVTQTSNGWSKVVDKSGRSGWVWNQLLRR
jgi:hypothetical protein